METESPDSIIKSVKSNSFISYLKSLKEVIESKVKIDIKTVLLILDNASIHRSKIVEKYLEGACWPHWYLPPYSPELAPVELYFGQLKKYIRSDDIGAPVSLNSRLGISYLEKTMKKINKQHILNQWTKWVGELNTIIDSLNNS